MLQTGRKSLVRRINLKQTTRHRSKPQLTARHRYTPLVNHELFPKKPQHTARDGNHHNTQQHMTKYRNIPQVKCGSLRFLAIYCDLFGIYTELLATCFPLPKTLHKYKILIRIAIIKSIYYDLLLAMPFVAVCFRTTWQFPHRTPDHRVCHWCTASLKVLYDT